LALAADFASAVDAIIDLTALDDLHGSPRLTGIGTLFLNDLNHIHTFYHPAEDDMLAIQVWCRHRAKKELRAVCIWPRVGHRQDPWTGVLMLEVFVLELRTIDRFASGAISPCEVTTLAHEAGDYSVEATALEVKRLA